MRTVKQQLGISQSSLSSTKRELQDKAALADILEKNLQLAQNQLSQAQEEVGCIYTCMFTSVLQVCEFELVLVLSMYNVA